MGLVSSDGEKHLCRREADRTGRHRTERRSVRSETDIGTNGDIELNNENGKAPIICGDLRHGIGKTAPTPNMQRHDQRRRKKPAVDHAPVEHLDGKLQLPPGRRPAPANPKSTPTPTCNGQKCEEVKRTKTEPWDADTPEHQHPEQLDVEHGRAATTSSAASSSTAELIMAAGSEIRHLRRHARKLRIESRCNPGRIHSHAPTSARPATTPRTLQNPRHLRAGRIRPASS